MKNIIIAVDGPSGAGKSTLSRLLARKLGLLYIDTGAMYRAAALAVMDAGISHTDERAVARVVEAARIDLAGDPDSLEVRLDGRDVSNVIRSEEISHLASVVSTNPAVRRELVRRQREMGEHGGVVMDGRDIGTVVFPRADAKFFLTATPEQRAERRFTEQSGGQGTRFEDVLEDINERDTRDASRADSPLAIAEDAVVIDTTEHTIDDVLARMLEVVRERCQ